MPYKNPEDKKAWRRTYQRAYNAEDRRALRAELAAFKLAAGCIDCGYNENSDALEFDHRDASTKRDSVAKLMGCGRKIVMEEVAKCDVRCANCHAIITQQRRRETP